MTTSSQSSTDRVWAQRQSHACVCILHIYTKTWFKCINNEEDATETGEIWSEGSVFQWPVCDVFLWFLRWPDQALVLLDCAAHRLWAVCCDGCTSNNCSKSLRQKTDWENNIQYSWTLISLLFYKNLWILQLQLLFKQFRELLLKTSSYT